MSRSSALVVGIDLGTTNSSVAAVVGGEPSVLADPQGRTTTPSVVSFTDANEILVGHRARSRLVEDPTNTIYSSKRLIGRPYSDPAVRIARAALPYEVVSGPDGQVAIHTRGGTYSVAEIAAMILRKMAAVARAKLGDQPVHAVITVPANFNDGQREYTRVAGRIAGLEVLRIVNEPTAAALAFGFDGSRDGVIAVYDFGGGTFDISVVEIRKGVYRVLSTAGDPFLGGDDIDVALAGRLADRFRRDARIDLRRSQTEWQRLLFAAEKAKIELASQEKTEVVIEGAGFGDSGAQDLRMDLSRTDLASIAYTFVERSIDLTRRGLQAARVAPSDVNDVVLVGGTTQVPLVADAVAEFFGKKPRREVDPMHAVALGASMHAALLTGGTVKPQRRSTPAAGNASAPGPGGGEPAEASSGAASAAAPAAVASALLIDVLPHSIGIAVAGGGVEWVLKSYSVVPTEEKRRFTTWREGQPEMRFVLIQGDSPQAAENTRLGDFVVSGLRPAGAGDVSVEVTFEVDVNGILCVTATDLDSGRQHSRRLKLSGPSEAQIAESRQRMGSGA
ncbi:MAG: Hsp70 family protein [Deltaproteobacteria bacterium]|nr:Hsp70 family protein [Deltaproteobacteria bacterium]